MRFAVERCIFLFFLHPPDFFFLTLACSRPLGMESKAIPDSKISGEKPLIQENKKMVKKHRLTLRDPRYKPHHARLGGVDKKEIFKVPMSMTTHQYREFYKPGFEHREFMVREFWYGENPAPYLSR